MPRVLKTNPFRPGKPITDPELFAGRKEELSLLVDALYQTGTKNASHIIVTGGRGIGKSSLVNQIDRLAEGDQVLLRELDIDPGTFKFKFYVCKHRATKGQSTANIVASLINQIPTKFSRDNVKEIVSDFLKKWKVNVSVGSIKAEYQPNVTADLSADFLRTIRMFWSAVDTELDGLIFIIDEVDTIADGDIASFCKITTEALVDAGLEQVAIMLVGISGAMEKLKQEHPSVGRIFRTIEVLPMTDIESSDIVSLALKGTNVTIQQSVTDQIVNLSTGYPSPVHLLGYHAFDEDDDQLINEGDFRKGLDKVIALVKREELSSVYQKAGTGDYRKILQAMANYEGDIVPLKHLADYIGRRSDAMSSYMNALIERGVVQRIDRAQYKISDPLLKIYIQKFGILQLDPLSDDGTDT